jgi:competence protein ComEA
MIRRAFFIISFLAVLLPLSFLALSAQAQSSEGEGTKLPAGKGKDLFVSACQQCHGLDLTTSSKRNLEEWRNVVNDMVSNGAALEKDEAELVSQYLAKYFGEESSTDQPKEAKEGSSASKVNVNSSTAKQLETGLSLSEKEANAVVEYREKNGKFAKLDDLKKVAGLDAKKIDAAKDRLEF